MVMERLPTRANLRPPGSHPLPMLGPPPPPNPPSLSPCIQVITVDNDLAQGIAQGINVQPSLLLLSPIGAEFEPQGLQVAPILAAVSPIGGEREREEEEEGWKTFRTTDRCLTLVPPHLLPSQHPTHGPGRHPQPPGGRAHGHSDRSHSPVRAVWGEIYIYKEFEVGF